MRQFSERHKENLRKAWLHRDYKKHKQSEESKAKISAWRKSLRVQPRQAITYLLISLDSQIKIKIPNIGLFCEQFRLSLRTVRSRIKDHKPLRASDNTMFTGCFIIPYPKQKS